jgi:hypothetical protein
MRERIRLLAYASVPILLLLAELAHAVKFGV